MLQRCIKLAIKVHISTIINQNRIDVQFSITKHKSINIINKTENKVTRFKIIFFKI